MGSFGMYYAWSPLARINVACPINRAVEDAGALDGREAYKKCGSVAAAIKMIEAVDSPKWFEPGDRSAYEEAAAEEIRAMSAAQ